MIWLVYTHDYILIHSTVEKSNMITLYLYWVDLPVNVWFQSNYCVYQIRTSTASSRQQLFISVLSIVVA